MLIVFRPQNVGYVSEFVSTLNMDSVMFSGTVMHKRGYFLALHDIVKVPSKFRVTGDLWLACVRWSNSH